MAVLSCGIVPVNQQPELKYLLLRAYNYWDFPKGKCNEGEDPISAALREVEEEAGIEDVDFFKGHIYTETLPYTKKKKIARYYLGKVLNITQVKIKPNPETGIVEHHEFRWCTYAEAFDLAGDRIRQVLKWADEQVNNENI